MPARMDPALRVLLSDRGNESGPSIGEASARSTRMVHALSQRHGQSDQGMDCAQWASWEGAFSGWRERADDLRDVLAIDEVLVLLEANLPLDGHLVPFALHTTARHIFPRARLQDQVNALTEASSCNPPPSCKIPSCKTRAQKARSRTYTKHPAQILLHAWPLVWQWRLS
jgi:hypothetical protein